MRKSADCARMPKDGQPNGADLEMVLELAVASLVPLAIAAHLETCEPPGIEQPAPIAPPRRFTVCAFAGPCGEVQEGRNKVVSQFEF